MILLVGKTCSGKNTIQAELIKAGIKPVVTYTTRSPRENEVDGVSYHFISEEEFLQKEKDGFFAETTSYDVASGDTWHYGSAVEDLSGDKVIIVNPHGLKQIRKNKSLNPVAFYILADEDVIWNRLRQRGDDSAEARRRLNADDKDFTDIGCYVDFAIRNERFSPAEVAELILYLYRKKEVLDGKEIEGLPCGKDERPEL